MGQIIAPFGVKGWVKIKVFTETQDSLLDYPVWWLNTQTGWQEYGVIEAKESASGLVAHIQGFDDRTSVEMLKGRTIGVPRAEFPKTRNGEYYWVDLLGLEVVNQQGERLGFVDHLIETGANDVLVVREGSLSGRLDAKPAERLIPYIEHIIVSVDLKNRRIVVDWGLDY